jgi:hypothetical protein
LYATTCNMAPGLDWIVLDAMSDDPCQCTNTTTSTSFPTPSKAKDTRKK